MILTKFLINTIAESKITMRQSQIKITMQRERKKIKTKTTTVNALNGKKTRLSICLGGLVRVSAGNQKGFVETPNRIDPLFLEKPEKGNENLTGKYPNSCRFHGSD